MFRTNWGILGQKMAQPHNSGLKLMKLMLMIFFPKKHFVEQLGKSHSATSTFKYWGSTAAVFLKCQKWITSYSDIGLAAIDKYYWVTKKWQQMLDGKLLPGELNKSTNF